MIKPDGVQRGLIGDILKRFEQKGFKLVAAKLAEKVNLRRREANEKLYEALGCGGLPPGPPAPPASEKSPPA